MARETYLITRTNKFPQEAVRNISYKVLNNNSYFAHGENILVMKLADNDEKVRRKAANIILHIKGHVTTTDLDDSGLIEKKNNEDVNESDKGENNYPSMKAKSY